MRALLVGLLLAAACGGRPAISLDPAWPQTPRDYDEATEAWTRHESRRHQLSNVIDVEATYKSPEWRAAFVERQTRALDLTPDARAALEAEQKRAAAEAHEFQVSLTAFDDTDRDLHQRKSPWSVALIDRHGRAIEPLSIKRERRNEEVVQALFPHIGEFDSVYVIRFAPDADLLGDGADRFQLRLSSPRGSVTLTWRDQR